MPTSESRGFRRWLQAGVSVTALFALAAGELGAVDFLRGDSNGDGAVSISDSYFTLAYLFADGETPECSDAVDANGDGTINISDAVSVLNFVAAGSEPPPPPFPDPGPGNGNEIDPLPCETYGGGEPREDPAAAIKIVEAVAEGGNQRSVSITLAFSSSGPIGGLYAEIVDGAAVLEEVSRVDSLYGDEELRFKSARKVDGVITVAFMPNLVLETDTSIAAGEDVEVLLIRACVKAGTEPGEYPLTLRAGELVSGCNRKSCGDAGRAIHPELVSAVLVVDQRVSADAICEHPEPPAAEPQKPPFERPSPPTPQLPDGLELAAEIRIGSADVRPGDEVQVPYIVTCNGEIQGFAFSIDFDEEVLQATEVEERFTSPDSLAFPFWVSSFNNENQTPGNAGVDEGFVVGGAVIDLMGRYDLLPADTDNEPVILHFTVNPDTPTTSTALRFMDGGVSRPGDPGVVNMVTAFGRSIDPVEVESIVMIDGLLNILPDVSAFFLRGDANGDREVDIADPQFVLGYLFRGAGSLPCRDAADANDDGRINVTDPIAILLYLFGAPSRLPEPFGTPGEDPTEDTLDCEEGP